MKGRKEVAHPREENDQEGREEGKRPPCQMPRRKVVFKDDRTNKKMTSGMTSTRTRN